MWLYIRRQSHLIIYIACGCFSFKTQCSVYFRYWSTNIYCLVHTKIDYLWQLSMLWLSKLIVSLLEEWSKMYAFFYLSKWNSIKSRIVSGHRNQEYPYVIDVENWYNYAGHKTNSTKVRVHITTNKAKNVLSWGMGQNLEWQMEVAPNGGISDGKLYVWNPTLSNFANHDALITLKINKW